MWSLRKSSIKSQHQWKTCQNQPTTCNTLVYQQKTEGKSKRKVTGSVINLREDSDKKKKKKKATEEQKGQQMRSTKKSTRGTIQSNMAVPTKKAVKDSAA